MRISDWSSDVCSSDLQVPTNQPLIEAMGARNPALLLLVVALLAPAYEELLFRRVLFGRLWAAGRPLLGIVLSSAEFACTHELPGTGRHGLLVGAPPGTCYARPRERRGGKEGVRKC